MLVDLSTAQAEAVTVALRASGYRWAAERWPPTWTIRDGRTATYECLMPAAGWQATLGALVELSIGPRGGNRKDAPTCALNARQRIAKALSEYNAHPALFEVGLPGNHADVFPVWRLASRHPLQRSYDIYPTGYPTMATFVHLVPSYDGRFTTWEAVLALWHRRGPNILNPEEHLRFVTG